MDWQNLKNNQQDWQIFKLRSELIGRIRAFFEKAGFLEVQTPLLSPALVPESYLEVFQTELKDKLGNSAPAFLTPSPELWHKKLLAAGSGNIFEITKSFRNTDLGGRFHLPEFTLLEWYRTGADYFDTMEDCQELIRSAASGNKLFYQGKSVNLTPPFERISIIEAFAKYAGIDDKTLFDKKSLVSWALKNNYRISLEDDWEMVYNLVFLKEIEPKLGFGRPTIIYDFPAEFAPLAKTNPKDSRVKERFELYIAGVELADAYSELTDPIEQKKQFEKEVKLRRKMDKLEHPVDWDFIKALESGLPDCSGVALGVDRLIMLLADKTEIGEVVLFGESYVNN
ncbi:MAG: EF-P lysine aminoacylase EpmA [Patescibacteria group bacterium]|nr:EF-P lysine aminoacylase GenX [Patescibacteria group bacterium]